MSKPVLGLYVACVVFGLWGLTHIYVESFHESLSYAILIISVVNFIALLSIGNVLRAIARLLTHVIDKDALRDVQASMGDPKYDICPHGIPRAEECGHCRRDEAFLREGGPIPDGIKNKLAERLDDLIKDRKSGVSYKPQSDGEEMPGNKMVMRKGRELPTGTRNEFGKPFPVSYKHAFVGYDGCEICGLGREDDIHDVPRGKINPA